MDTARLVYSTDPKKLLTNVQFYDESIGKEAHHDMKETIQEINKSRRRKVTVAKISERDKYKHLSEVTKIIKMLTVKPTSTKEIYEALFTPPRKPSTVKYLQNLLQTIRHGSENIVFCKDNLWQINKNYVSGDAPLIEKIMNNWGARHKGYKRKSKPPIMEKPTKPIPPIPPPVSNNNIGLPTKIVLSGDQEAITVPVKIALTIQVKIEVIQ
jgi:hypothetical protein